MKRIVIWFCLISVMVFCLPAHAEWELPVLDETFVIRNGISFGMTKEEVINVEQNNGNVYDSNEATCIDFSDVSFLGKSAQLSHYFTKDEKLRSFAYSKLGKSHTFTDLFESLAKKYGAPMLTKELSLFATALWQTGPFFFFDLDSPWSADTLFGGTATSSLDGSLYISNYAFWLVQYTDCAVLIELAEANKGKYLSLGYASISHEDMEAWLGYREKENNETQSSYANDI